MTHVGDTKQLMNDCNIHDNFVQGYRMHGAYYLKLVAPVWTFIVCNHNQTSSEYIGKSKTVISLICSTLYNFIQTCKSTLLAPTIGNYATIEQFPSFLFNIILPKL